MCTMELKVPAADVTVNLKTKKRLVVNASIFKRGMGGRKKLNKTVLVCKA